MIIVAIEGGLGNQMFQYALFFSLKKQYGSDCVKLDLSLINSQKHNGYELESVFNIKEDICTYKDVIRYSEYCSYSIPGNKVWNLLFAIGRRIRGRKKSFILQEDSTEYMERVFTLDTSQNYYLKGVWANELYYKKYAKEIRDIFSFPPLNDRTNIGLIEKITCTESVSIHFRGGDYYSEGMSVLGTEYYQKAIGIIEKRIDNPTYFVFTDDIEHAKKIVKIKQNSFFVCNNKGADSYKDMALMRLCKHNIIANSTFSFWGAYLNTNKDKVVIGAECVVGNCKAPYEFEGIILI